MKLIIGWIFQVLHLWTRLFWLRQLWRARNLRWKMKTNWIEELLTYRWAKAMIYRYLIHPNCLVEWIWNAYLCSKKYDPCSMTIAPLMLNSFFPWRISCGRKTGSTFSETDQCILVKLLQQSSLPKEARGPPKVVECSPPVVQETNLPETVATSCMTSHQTHKRCSLGPADDSNPKRLKVPKMKIPAAGPLATRVVPLKPSRGATSSLMELLTERPTDCGNQSSSVLQNLLVSGHDFRTGHDLQKRRSSSSSCKAVSSTSSCFVFLLSPPQLSLQKVSFF